ncbi:MAG: CAP domain-containing protein [Gemmatirosa sp.]
MARSLSSIVTLAALAALGACADSPAAPLAPTEDSALAARRRPTAPAPTPTPTPAPTTGATVTGCTGTAVTLTADEKTSLDQHQAQRAASGLAAFCVHPRLVDAARAHSADMLAKGYFSHTGKTGESFSARVTRFGYTGWRALAENIAWGSGSYGSAQSIFTGWMNSSGHRANIVNGNLREIGIGVAAGTFQGYSGARIYTADFGTR